MLKSLALVGHKLDTKQHVGNKSQRFRGQVTTIGYKLPIGIQTMFPLQQYSLATIQSQSLKNLKASAKTTNHSLQNKVKANAQWKLCVGIFKFSSVIFKLCANVGM